MKFLLAIALFAAACSATGASPAPAEPTAPASTVPAFTPTAFSVKVTGSGRPVIFIPGLASPGSVWDGSLAHLAGHVQAHVLTLAGFAGQPPIAGPFMQQVHDQIVQYIKANRLEHPLVVGHSLGGVMALWLAESDPDVAGIVDVDGFPYLAGITNPSVTPDQAAQQAKAIHDQMATMTPEQLGAQMGQFLKGMVSSADDLQRLTDAAGKSDPPTVATAFSEMLSKDLRPDLAKITVPVTIVAATDSAAPPDKLKAAWHSQVDAIPHLDLEFVGAAKHFVMLDQPDVFYSLLDKALAK